MWRWLRLLTGWHMRDWLAYTFPSLPLAIAPQVRSLRIGWKKNGLELDDVPVLTTADELLVRAELRFAAATPVRKADLTVHAGRQHVSADSLVFNESVGRQSVHCAEFHLQPPETSETLELCWRGKLLCQAALPVLSLSQFIEQLRLEQPTLHVTLLAKKEHSIASEYTVPCLKYPRLQGRHIVASAELVSPTPLVGLLDCQPVVAFREQSSGQSWEVPLRLSAEQLKSRRAIVSVRCPVRPHRLGCWNVEWRLSSKTLASCELEVLSMRSLYRRIEVVESRFVVYDECSRSVRTERRLAQLPPDCRVGPCFLLRSAEPGLSFLARLEVFAQLSDNSRSVQLSSEDVLITDAPTPFVPGTVSARDLEAVVSFDLRSNGVSLASLRLSPIPRAKINGEGAIQELSIEDNGWSPMHEEELNERLKRLMGPP